MNFKGIAFLSWAYLAYRPLKTVVLVMAVALTIFLPFALQVFIGESTRILRDRARATPLVVGPKGSSIDLTLNTLYFTPQALPPLGYAAYSRLRESVDGSVIPMHVRFRAGEAPIVGSSLSYFHHRGLETNAGRMMTRLGDCVLGASVAKERGLKPGDTIVSTPENVFDLAGVYPLRMRITGVLEPSHTPDDEAVFVDLKTAWIIEGLAHGHEDLSKPDAADAVLERDEGVIRGNASVREFNEVTDTNIGSFHFHGDTATFPISAVIVLPADEKARTMTLGDYQSEEAGEQIVMPLEAVTQLTDTLFATRRMVLVAFVLLGATALALAALVFILSFRLRDREMTTYHKIGATHATIRLLKSAEVGVIAIAGVLVAVGAVAATRALAAEILPKLLG